MTYPLIKELGLDLDVFANYQNCENWYVRAADLERVLSQGVYMSMPPRKDTDGLWAAHETVIGETLIGHTHTGLLIGVKPIQRDTAEGLLRELVNESTSIGQKGSDLLERARKLLEQK
jgi:hypothetical protein